MLIDNKEYKLSARRMAFKYNLLDEAKKLEFPEKGKPLTVEQIKNAVVVRAKSVSDAIYTTYLNMSWWEKIINFRYRKFKSGTYYIYKYCTDEHLLEAEKELESLEGSGKKKSSGGKGLGRNVANGLIELHFGIKEPELLNVKEYNQKVFTIFNNAILHSLNAKDFQFKDDEEAYNDMEDLIKEAKEQGYSF